MSYLKVTTRTGEVVRKEFIDMFVAIADGTSDEAPIAMTHIDPIATLTTEMSQENRDIQYMAVFMLLSGSQMASREPNYRFEFGDVDLLDRIDDWSGLTVLQHLLEDAEIPTLKDLFKMFNKINDDCMRACEDIIPLTDKEYYSEQIQNIYNLTEECADELADQMRKFKIFQASGKDVPNLGQYSDCWEGPDCPGRVYLAAPTEDCGLVIADSSGWFDENNSPTAWYLQIANCEYSSNDLEELEFELFDFANSAGWTDDL